MYRRGLYNLEYLIYEMLWCAGGGKEEEEAMPMLTMNHTDENTIRPHQPKHRPQSMATEPAFPASRRESKHHSVIGALLQSCTFSSLSDTKERP